MKPEEAKAQAQQDLDSLVARVPRATKGWTAQIDPSRVRLTHLGKFLKLFWGALPIGGLAQLSGATRSCKCTIGCHETLQHGRDQLCRIRDGLPGFPRKRLGVVKQIAMDIGRKLNCELDRLVNGDGTEL
jgi:hypothetical protein